MLSRVRWRQEAIHVRTQYYSEWRICKALIVSGNTVRYVYKPRKDEDVLMGRYSVFRRPVRTLRLPQSKCAALL
jgi:hypothetical protein